MNEPLKFLGGGDSGSACVNSPNVRAWGKKAHGNDDVAMGSRGFSKLSFHRLPSHMVRGPPCSFRFQSIHRCALGFAFKNSSIFEEFIRGRHVSKSRQQFLSKSK